MDLSCGQCNVISLFCQYCSVNGSVCLVCCVSDNILGVVVILLFKVMELMSVGGDALLDECLRCVSYPSRVCLCLFM